MLCALRSLASRILRLDSVSLAGDAVAVRWATVVVISMLERSEVSGIRGGGMATVAGRD